MAEAERHEPDWLSGMSAMLGGLCLTLLRDGPLVFEESEGRKAFLPFCAAINEAVRAYDSAGMGTAHGALLDAFLAMPEDFYQEDRRGEEHPFFMSVSLVALTAEYVLLHLDDDDEEDEDFVPDDRRN